MSSLTSYEMMFVCFTLIGNPTIIKYEDEYIMAVFLYNCVEAIYHFTRHNSNDKCSKITATNDNFEVVIMTNREIENIN